jgi:hypothetical protein
MSERDISQSDKDKRIGRLLAALAAAGSGWPNLATPFHPGLAAGASAGVAPAPPLDTGAGPVPAPGEAVARAPAFVSSDVARPSGLSALTTPQIIIPPKPKVVTK